MVVLAGFRGEAAVYRAAATSSCSKGLCLRYVRTYYGIPAKYGSAYSAWRNMTSKRRRQSYPPPRGYPVFWSGGSQTFGHIAISLGDGYVRSTDWPSAGRVGNAKISDISAKWYMTYLGWGTELNGEVVWCRSVDASRITTAASGHPWSYKPGVWTVQRSLWKRGYLGFRYVNGYWGGHTREAYKGWERHLGLTENGVPRLPDLRRLARVEPHFIVKP